jgi:lipopolysaccharide/colanic/teichoic acid biosynthesis glycosyltransferase
VEYVQKRSLIMDLHIVAKTIKVVLNQDGAC